MAIAPDSASASAAPPWPCVAEAQNARNLARCPLLGWDGAAWVPVGSVAAAHLPMVERLRDLIERQGDALALRPTRPAELTAALADANLALREAGLIPGWRGERFAVFEPHSLRRLGGIERAATRFWGLLTLGAHANGYVCSPAGQVAGLWIGQRAASKSIDPNAYDNLIGAGVGDGQTPRQALVREAWEEAGLREGDWLQLRLGRCIQMHRRIPEGLQFERLYSFDLQLPEGRTPVNQDGEVQGFEYLAPALALARAQHGAMTVDSSLVTLDFAERHGLCLAQPAAAGLWMDGSAHAG